MFLAPRFAIDSARAKSYNDSRIARRQRAESGGWIMAFVTLKSSGLTVTISTLGAEIQSVRDSNGIERMHDGDPRWWKSHAPLLFPVAGGLRDDEYLLNGKAYHMPKHGFAKLREFAVEEAGETRAVFLLAGEAARDEGFPFDYELRVKYVLRGCRLEVSYIVANLDARTMYYGIGAHEAYSTPEGIEHYRAVFDETESIRSNVLHGNLLGHETIELTHDSDTLPLKYDYFAVDAIVLRGVNSRAVTLRTDLHDRAVRVEFPGFDYLLFWTKPNAPYICIEPWCNFQDWVDADKDITHKPGVIALQPGERRIHTHTIEFIG